MGTGVTEQKKKLKEMDLAIINYIDLSSHYQGYIFLVVSYPGFLPPLLLNAL